MTQQHTTLAIIPYFIGPVITFPTESTSSAAPPASEEAEASAVATISFASLFVVTAERRFFATACAARSAEMFCLKLRVSPLRQIVSPILIV
jgi:hypothetical protein